MLTLFKNFNDFPTVIQARVTPNAPRSYIKVKTRDDGSELYRIYITASADSGQANLAIIDLLSRTLGVPKSHISIIRGEKSKDKTISIQKQSTQPAN